MFLKACKKSGLDLAILDLGEDGHTAGLFAGSHALRVADRNVVPVEDGKVWERISMTFSFLAKTDVLWFTVTGESNGLPLQRFCTNVRIMKIHHGINVSVVYCRVQCFHKNL